MKQRKPKAGEYRIVKHPMEEIFWLEEASIRVGAFRVDYRWRPMRGFVSFDAAEQEVKRLTTPFEVVATYPARWVAQ